MSYIVFALKWRPKSFDEIIGQQHIVLTLKNAIQKDRIAHAYLFAGPRGVGKTTTARILAKALNCQQGPTTDPCGKCISCQEISKGKSLDVFEIDGASNRGIDEIRALRESVKFAPTTGKYKIYIIDEVHQITTEGFNALLKTLEEPPPFVKFIFATTHPHKVMPTILSRCQRLDFRRIGIMEIIRQLEAIIAAEGVCVDRDVLYAVAKSSDGSLRDAESVLDQLISFAKDKVTLSDVTTMLGLVEQDTLFDMGDAIIRKDARSALRLLDDIIDNGKDPGIFLSALIEHFRNLLIAKVTQADSEIIDLPKDICERLLQQAQAMNIEDIMYAFNMLVLAQEMSKRLDSIRIPLEINLVKLTLAKKDAPVQPSVMASKIPLQHQAKKPDSQVVHKKTIVPSHTQDKEPVVKDRPKEDPPVAQGPSGAAQAVTLDEVQESWQRLINNLSTIKMSVATYLNEGSPLKVQGQLITVGFPKHCSLHKEALETKDNRGIIEKHISELFNAGLRVNFTLSEDIPPAKEKETGDTFIQSALDMFHGRVIKKD